MSADFRVCAFFFSRPHVSRNARMRRTIVLFKDQINQGCRAGLRLDWHAEEKLMATNPRIPNDDRDPVRHRLETVPDRKPPQGAWGGVTAALIVIGILLALVLYFLPRAPKMTQPSPGAAIPAQATGAMLQIQNVQLAPDPTGRAVIIQGDIMNNGTQTVTGAMMHVQFMGANGANAGSADAPVQVLDTEGKGAKTNVTDAKMLTDAPMKPNDHRAFRVQVNDVPADWNHSMPQISFTQVASHP